MKALLALEDGLVLRGRSFTGEGESAGEVVFNTAMTGYQEILTDPSYKGQIVTMTYPLIGNYGINPEDIESRGVQVEGFIVKEYHPYPSNWRSQGRLADYLKAAGKLGVEGFDTRAITKRLRQHGAMRGLISTLDLDPESLVRRAREIPSMEGQDLVPLVTCKRPYWWPEFPQGIRRRGRRRHRDRPGSPVGRALRQEGRALRLWRKVQYNQELGRTGP